jgi:hypothetical protein
MGRSLSVAASHPVAPQDAVASFDSGTAFLASLARALHQRDFPHLGQSPLKVPLVLASATLPRRLRTRAYSIASGREGIAPDHLGGVNLTEVADWLASHYAPGRSPGVLIGSANGALTHLAAACGVPWLPQTLLVPVRRPRSDPGDVRAAMDFGLRNARTLLEANPDAHLHHMHDANQDPLTLAHMAYFRVKWNRLPEPYQRFLREHLAPGAPVVVVVDESTWPVTRLGDRHVFQVGAHGGMEPQEYLRAPGVPTPDDVAPEAEWGFSFALLEEIREWARAHGHPLVEMRYGHPQEPAGPVAEATRTWLRERGETAQRLLVSSFIVHDPWRTITTASVPFWTFFPVRRAAEDLTRHLDRVGYDDIDVLLFNHGARSQGLADADTWQALASRARRRGRLLAVDPATFPADFTAFARYSSALRRLPERPLPSSPLPLAPALADLAADPRLTVVTGERDG